MSGFASPLLIRAWTAGEVSVSKRGRQHYDLTSPLAYDSLSGGLITVPAGFSTDFASIPRLAWSILDPEDPAILYPSVIHDYLYSLGGCISEHQRFTRKQADDILREAMASCGAARWQMIAVYRAVRLFGASHWK